MTRKRIFLVDDDDMLRTILNDQLSKSGFYEIHEFSTGEECVKNLYLEPDVVILDYELNSVNPDAQDGYLILQKIKQVRQDIYVIMMSSQTQYGKAAQTIVKGALQYVVKGKDAYKSVEKILKGLT